MNNLDLQHNIKKLFENNKLVPVVVIDDQNSVRKLAEIFIEHGIKTMEITLRTPNALKAIEIIAKEFPQITVGAGTILKIEDLQNCASAGAQYMVSPTGQTDIIDAVLKHNYPLLPAASTVTEAHNLLIKGFTYQKFFPAVLSGGVPMLKALGSVLPMIKFCPTGGINDSNINEFLKLDNVVGVGSSGLCSQADLASQDWKKITNKCKVFSSI
jgi:2-dehydro-3-deoxyphosphogluconate aldolase/(4S)-4-hydroxy-2-oxoglutarate aldolase